jgi:ATP-dependent Lon protease
VLAAHRAGIKTVLLPKRNLKDLVELPKRARNDIKIVPVEHMDQVLDVALLPVKEKPRPTRTRRKKESTEAAVENQASTTKSGDSYPAIPAA